MTNAELIGRLESEPAEYGREDALDAEIVAFLNGAIVKPYPPTDDFGPKNRWQFWSKDGQHFLGSEHKYPVPKYTTSLDASISLVEKTLPGWQFTIYHDGAQVSRTDPPSLHWGRSNSRPRALLAAMIRAAQESK